MKYRDHRGSLADSMETVREVYTVEEIMRHLNEYFNLFGRTVIEIKFSHQGLDDRIGWDTWLVLQRLDNEDFFTVAGMSDGCIKK